jgi:hypothetical protein
MTPNLNIYNELYKIVTTTPTTHMAEQGTLNDYFPPVSTDNMKPMYTRTDLPMKYNVNMQACRSFPERFAELWSDARIVHWAGAKPGTGQCPPNENSCMCEALTRWQGEYREMLEKFGWSDIEQVTPP